MTAAPSGPRPATIRWIDWARIVGILAVITIHVVSLTVLEFADVDNATWLLATVLFAASVWSVPLFVMLSGALLLDPARPMDVGTFYRRRFTRVLIPLVAWSLIYWAWIVLVRGEERPPDAFFRSVLLARPYAHLHFLFIIVGLYLITPFLRVFTDHASRRMIAGAAGVVLVIATLYRMLAFGDLTEAPTAFTHFVPYVGYFLAGLVLRDVVLDRRGMVVAGLVAALCVIAQVLATYGLWWIGDADHATVPEHYFSPLVIVLTLTVFLLFRSVLAEQPVEARSGQEATVARGGRAGLRSRVAAMTLGVYLVHPMILDLIRRQVDLDATVVGAVVLFPLTIAVAFLGSLVMVEILGRIPGLRRIVGVG